jgi:hypothetical protein
MKTEISVGFRTENDAFEFETQIRDRYDAPLGDPNHVRVISHANYNNVHTEVLFPKVISDEEYELIRAWAKDHGARSIRRTLEELFPSQEEES